MKVEIDERFRINCDKHFVDVFNTNGLKCYSMQFQFYESFNYIVCCKMKADNAICVFTFPSKKWYLEWQEINKDTIKEMIYCGGLHE